MALAQIWRDSISAVRRVQSNAVRISDGFLCLFEQLADVWRTTAAANSSRPPRGSRITWTSFWSGSWRRSSWTPNGTGTRRPGEEGSSTAGGSWNTCWASRGKRRAARTCSFSNDFSSARRVVLSTIKCSIPPWVTRDVSLELGRSYRRTNVFPRIDLASFPKCAPGGWTREMESNVNFYEDSAKRAKSESKHGFETAGKFAGEFLRKFSMVRK